MTQIDPALRPTATELLNSPIFIKYKMHFEKFIHHYRFKMLDKSDRFCLNFKVSDVHDHYKMYFRMFLS